MSKTDPLLTIYQAARVKGVAPRTVERAVKLKELATADYAIKALPRPGASVKFRKSDLHPLVRYRDLMAWKPRTPGEKPER